MVHKYATNTRRHANVSPAHVYFDIPLSLYPLGEHPVLVYHTKRVPVAIVVPEELCQ